MSAPGQAAEAWRPPRTRLPAIRVRLPVPGSTWTTPALLYVFLGAILASTALLFLSITVGVDDSGAGFQTVGTDSAPSINDALDVYSNLSDMDAHAVEYVLLGSRPPIDPAAAADVRHRYEQSREAVSDGLVSAAHDYAFGPGERTSIMRMLTMTQDFDLLVGEAMALTDRGDRAGALEAYHRATDLMHAPFDGLLETALNLAATDHDRLTAGYESASQEGGRDVLLVVTSGLLLLGSLTGLQAALAGRTRRALNPLALVASAVALWLLAGAALSLQAGGDQLRVAKRDSYDSVYALRQLRAIAVDARADESRYLVDLSDPASAQRAVLDEVSFLDKSLELARFREPVTLAGGPGKQTYDAALAGQLAAVRRGRTSGLGGAFGRALGNLSLPDDYATALATLTTYAVFERDDRTLRTDIAAGNVAEAVRFDTSSAAKDAGGDFNTFTAAVDRWIHLHQQAFDQAIRDGSDILSGWQWYRFAAVAVFVLPLLGALPRLVEFGLPGLRGGGWE